MECGDHSCRDEKEAEILHTPLFWHGLGLQKEQDRWKYPHLWPEETGYLPRAAKCADKKLLEVSQLTNSTSLPLKPFFWPTCTSWFHFSLSEEQRTSWQIQAMCGTLPSGLPFSQQGFGQWSQAYLHSARHREGGESSGVACGNGKLAETVRPSPLIHPLTARVVQR